MVHRLPINILDGKVLILLLQTTILYEISLHFSGLSIVCAIAGQFVLCVIKNLGKKVCVNRKRYFSQIFIQTVMFILFLSQADTRHKPV